MKRITLNSTPHRRSGFTLLELLMVVAVIAILMAILIPAISGVRYRARIAQVTAELQQFEQALATFQNRFGRYPPSQITLWGTQAGWDANPADKSVIRSIWPDFDFATGGRGANPASTHPWGVTNKQLSGDECLVFFLGGVPDYSSSGIPALRGFSKNTRWPFALAGENRDGPFFTEFKGERLVDVEISYSETTSGGIITPKDQVVESPDGVPSYLDSLPGQSTPYYYAAALNGRYLDGDRCYFQSDGKTPWKKESFQILSPGSDGQFGKTIKSPAFKASYNEQTKFANVPPIDRRPERDNISNFSGGIFEQ